MTGMQNARHPERADYDWRAFALLVRRQLASDGRGYRALAGEIGVTFTDLSRAASGQMIAVHKVIAICDWLRIAPRAFYLPPVSSALTADGLRAGRPMEAGVRSDADDAADEANSNCCSASNVKHGARLAGVRS